MAVAEWFAGFPSEVESREDAYLLDPDLGGLSVKIRGGQMDIYVMNRDGSGVKRLTTSPAADSTPTWSPTGPPKCCWSRPIAEG